MKVVKSFFSIIGALVVTAVLVAVLYCVIRGVNPLALLSGAVGTSARNELVYKNADGKELHINTYPPMRELFGRSPVVIYLHGGGWESGSHVLSGADFEIMNPMRELGITVMSVEYRLTGESTRFPAHIEDVTDAIRYIVSHSEELGIDKDRLCLFGGSAGAHLSLLAALAKDEFRGDRSDDYDIRCVIALSAPMDFVDLSSYPEDDLVLIKEMLRGFLGGSYEQIPDVYRKASPIGYIKKSAPPILMAHGDKDRIVPIAQSDSFYEKGTAAGMNIEYIRVINGNHGLGSDNGQPTSPGVSDIVKTMVAFLLKNLMV